MKKKLYTRPISVVMSDEMFAHIKSIIDQGNIGFSDYIREAIKEKLRTAKVRGCFSANTVQMMAFKLCESVQKRWLRLHDHEKLAMIIRGVNFVDGVHDPWPGVPQSTPTSCIIVFIRY
jgi:hypothetical protein